MTQETETETPLDKLMEVEAIAFTERDGRRYVAVRGRDSRNRTGHVICDFNNGTLIYEHATWLWNEAYLMERSRHYEYEQKLAQLDAETIKLYFSDTGIETILRRDLFKQVESRERVLAPA